MNAESPDLAETVTATVKFGTDAWQMQTRVTVPAGPTSMRALLPVMQSLTNSIVDAAVQMAEAEGRKVSCCAGCGACCRQMVPISEVEARQIGQLVANLPEPRRATVRARFADASRRLDQAGLLDKMRRRDQWDGQEIQPLGIEYFRQGIPCPFLEDESCSIHPDRPLACREYLVTSPAEFCARPSAETIDQVELPVKVWPAVARCDAPDPGARFVRWVPLVLAPEWAADHPDEPPPRPGPELLREFFDHLTRHKTNASDPPAEESTGSASPASKVTHAPRMTPSDEP